MRDTIFLTLTEPGNEDDIRKKHQNTLLCRSLVIDKTQISPVLQKIKHLITSAWDTQQSMDNFSLEVVFPRLWKMYFSDWWGVLNNSMWVYADFNVSVGVLIKENVAMIRR